MKIVYDVSELIEVELYGKYSKYMGNSEWMVTLKMIETSRHGHCFVHEGEIEGEYEVIHRWGGGGTLGPDAAIHMEGVRIKISTPVKLVETWIETTWGSKGKTALILYPDRNEVVEK